MFLSDMAANFQDNMTAEINARIYVNKIYIFFNVGLLYLFSIFFLLCILIYNRFFSPFRLFYSYKNNNISFYFRKYPCLKSRRRVVKVSRRGGRTAQGRGFVSPVSGDSSICLQVQLKKTDDCVK